MLSLLTTLAQTSSDLGNYSYSYSYSSTTGDSATAAAALGIILAVYGVVFLFVAVPAIISWWSLFKKAGQPGWAALIPIYNTYVMWKISGTEVISFILCFLPFVNIVGIILILVGMSKKYDKPATVWLAALIPIIGVFMVKGTSYIGAGVTPAAPTQQPPQAPAQPAV